MNNNLPRTIKKSLAGAIILSSIVCNTASAATVNKTTSIPITQEQSIQALAENDKIKKTTSTLSTTATISKDSKYTVSNAKKVQEKIIDRIYKNNKKNHKNITKEKIRYAFVAGRDRVKNKKNITMREYYRIVAIILATMETETDFTKMNHRNSNGTIDYGIMQVNQVVIPTIRKALGSSVASGLKYNNSDNIKAGSYEVISLCYNKAKKKHPSRTIWWTYAYYNRGLYFENYKYNYNQANTRSQIFIKKFNRYYKDFK